MRKITCIAVLILIAAFSFSAYGQNRPDVKDEYFPDFRKDPDMPGRLEKSIGRQMPQYGIWINSSFVHLDDNIGELSSNITVVRPWLKLPLWDNSFFYLRGKYTFKGVLNQKGYDKQKITNILDLDLGYFKIGSRNQNVVFHLGRKYYNLGTGLVLNGRGDGFQLDLFTKYVNFKVFSMYTGLLVKDDNPYNLSDRDIANGADRLFTGANVNLELFNQTLFMYAMDQADFSNVNGVSLSRSFPFLDYSKKLPFTSNRYSSYNSQYYGIGLKGAIFSGLVYYGEIIHERGRSYTSGSYNITKGFYNPLSFRYKKNKIRAWAGLANLYYYVDLMLRPVIIAQYAYGSGDRHRDNYKLPYGNSFGVDEGFIYFGTYVGGYALRPILANLHVIRAGFSLSPLSWSDKRYLRDMTVIAKYSNYMKDKVQAPINYGFDAVRKDRHVGHGVDVSLRWLVFSDLSFYLNYGCFIPGKASGVPYYIPGDQFGNAVYRGAPNRHIVMTGLNISF